MGRFRGFQPGRYVGDVIRVGQNVFGKSAVLYSRRTGPRHRPSPRRINNTRNDRMPSRATALRRGHLPSRWSRPRPRRRPADAFMAGNERRRRFHGPVTMPRHGHPCDRPAGIGLDENLARSRSRDVPFLKFQGFPNCTTTAAFIFGSYESFRRRRRSKRHAPVFCSRIPGCPGWKARGRSRNF